MSKRFILNGGNMQFSNFRDVKKNLYNSHSPRTSLFFFVKIIFVVAFIIYYKPRPYRPLGALEVKGQELNLPFQY